MALLQNSLSFPEEIMVVGLVMTPSEAGIKIILFLLI